MGGFVNKKNIKKGVKFVNKIGVAKHPVVKLGGALVELF